MSEDDKSRYTSVGDVTAQPVEPEATPYLNPRAFPQPPGDAPAVVDWEPVTTGRLDSIAPKPLGHPFLQWMHSAVKRLRWPWRQA